MSKSGWLWANCSESTWQWVGVAECSLEWMKELELVRLGGGGRERGGVGDSS